MAKAPVTKRIRRNLRSLGGRLLDGAIGIESSTQVSGLPDENLRGYQPSYWLALAVGMRGIRPAGGDCFVDLGCGKGRVLYLASWYRFERIIGVDLDPRMTAIARQNLARARGPRRVRSVEILEQDARMVALPDRLRVAFLFNPFVGPVFRTVVQRLADNADRNAMPLRLIYANPVEKAVLASLGFTQVHESRHCSVFDYFTGL
jgi:SAM-dependent methyltransferase